MYYSSKTSRHRQNGLSYVPKKILTWMLREAREGLKAAVGNRVKPVYHFISIVSFLFFSVSFSQILVFPGSLCSKACQHMFDIVGLSQAKNIFKFVQQSLLLFQENKPNNNKGISKHLRFCWQQLLGPLRNTTISLKSIRPTKTEINIIDEKVFDKCLHPGSNLQLAPSCDHCSNALPTELPPLLRSYL